MRALFLALLVWAGLGLLRVRNVVAQKTAWTLVLIAAFVMPFLPHWQGLSVPPLRLHVFQSAQPTVPPADPIQLQSAPLPSPARTSPAATHTASQPVAETLQFPRVAADRYPVPYISHSAFDASPSPAPEPAPAPSLLQRLRQFTLQPIALAWLVYLAVCAVLLARLAIGVGFAARLWMTARPAASAPQLHLPAELSLRSSSRVASPVALGSGIVLPLDYANWDAEKLRVVLAHERAHIRQGDFYLQLLARLYAALFWLSPLGWWLKRKLSDLGEAISDHAGLEVAASRLSYAQVLLEFAVLPRPNLIGVPMAHSSSLSQRIERFLNESTFRSAFTGRSRTLAAALLVPMALFAATTLVRVEAASQVPVAAVHQDALPIAPVRPAALQPLRPAAAAPALQVVLPPAAISAIARVEAAVMPQAPVAPVAPIQPLPQPQVSHVEEPALVPPAPIAAPSPAAAPAPPVMAADDDRPQATFDRTLTAGAQLVLWVSTGSGNIKIVHGSGSTVQIHGIVRAGHDGTPDQVREIAANPPIEQSGNTIRIGPHQDNQENLRHISISYEIEAPSSATLIASTGSGNITDDGVGRQAKLNTGSGNIHATGLTAGFAVQTGSGNIYIEQSGEGDVAAQTGSGNIELKGPIGGLKAQTGSGAIKITGTPTADWKLQTGSGSIELWTGNTALTLDASFGSGGFHTDREMLTQGMSDHHHVTGKLGGGGPLVRMETGSGDIRVH